MISERSINNEEKMLTVGDITEEHYGWVVAVKEEDRVCPERDIYLIAHRSWEYNGQQKVGLTNKEFEKKYIRGTEYHYLANTPCRLVRQWKKPRRKVV